MVIQHKYSHVDIARIAIKGGADMIQFRDKNMSSSEMIDTTNEIKKICSKYNITFIINDRVDVAMIVDADGVHLGKEDITIEEGRKLFGKDKIIGGTAHSLGQAMNAQKNGADYIGFGHIFETQSKLKTTKPKGLDSLKKVVLATKLPVLAIGGINISNTLSVMQTGVYGIAIIGGVLKSDNPILAVKILKRIVYVKKN
jgi:thiamine-phosphate pyrophosphorylase